MDPAYNEKFIQAKVSQAQRGRSAPNAGDLTSSFPGQTITGAWPILDLGVRPVINLGAWTLKIDGLVEKPAVLSWEAFLRLPKTAVDADFHCVTRWSRLDNLWEGVAFKTIFDIVRPKPEARFLLFTAGDGYTTNVPISDVGFDNCLLAITHDKTPLTSEHGGPLRVIIPHLYGWKGAKWVTGMTFSAEDKPGFWEVRGYHNHGSVSAEERYSN